MHFMLSGYAQTRCATPTKQVCTPAREAYGIRCWCFLCLAATYYALL
jgi:hypothetical protein